MQYIFLETKSLVTLVGRKANDKIDWEAMGTSADLINLSDIRLSKTNEENNKITYLLPIDNIDAANQFKQKCADKYNIDVEIIDEPLAVELNKQYL